MHPQFYEASITIVLASWLAAYTLIHGDGARPFRIFVALVGSIIVWAGGIALSHVFEDLFARQFAVRVAFLGIFALPPLWYVLALHLTRRDEEPLARRFVTLLVLPSLLSFAAMSTDAWHNSFVRDPRKLVEAGPQLWAGPLFWAWAGWAYLLVLGASCRYARWSWRLVTTDSRLRGALVCVASVLPLAGNFVHLIGRDATDHDRTPLLLGVASAMLFVANWRFRLLDALPIARRDVIEQLRDGVIIADSQGVIIDMNAAAERMVEASICELAGQPIVRAVAAQSVDRFDFDEQAFNRVVVEMCSSDSGFETYVENFEGRHFEIRGAAVSDVPGESSGFYIIMRDVTERCRFEEVQRESQRVRSIASLAAGITHEVNNPLSYVRANVSHVMETLADLSSGKGADQKDQLAEELRSVLAEALEGVDRIGSIIDRVRRFGHSRAGVREAIAIDGLLEDAARIAVRGSGPEIRTVVEVEEGVGKVVGFRDALLEGILNLLDNAHHALRETGGEIRLRARLRGHSIRIEVEDDGAGVPERLRERIFEPFFAAESQESGKGLGLTICAKLIADFGGTLSHEPVATGGARFVIELPDSSLADD